MTRLALAGSIALAGTACWTGGAVEPVAPASKAERCTIRELDVEISGLAELSIEGLVFARQSGLLQRLAVTFEGPRARAKLENEQLVLEGELVLSELSIRPREIALREGWIEIRSATAQAAAHGMLQLEVRLPERLAPRTAVFTYPCHALTFAAPPEPATDDSDVTETLEVAVGTRLSPTPGAPPVVRISGIADDDEEPVPVEVTVLARKGALARVRIEGDNPVSGWVASTALAPVSIGQLGGFGFGRGADPRSLGSCSRDTPIYVRVGGRVVRVGKIKKEQRFHLGSQPAEREGETVIDLGMVKPAVQPFIKQADFTHCQ